jgi:ATP-dependent Clp protease ATP-binding subunit ClpC
MKIYQGKLNIGKLKKSNLIIDWDYLSKNYGLRRESEILDNAIGKLLLLLAGIGFFVIAVYYLINHENPLAAVWQIKGMPEAVFWGFYLMFVYAFYLLRNRERYTDSLKVQNLEKLRRHLRDPNFAGDIDLTIYFSNDMLNIFDDLLRTDGHYFLETILKKLLKFPSIKLAVPRLGINTGIITDYLKTMGMDLNSHIDEWMYPIILNAFIIALQNNFEKIDEMAVFIYLCRVPLRQVLLKNEVSEKDIIAFEAWVKNVRDTRRFAKMYKVKSALKPVSTVNRAFTSRYSPTLIRFSRDYTAEVIKQDFVYSIGREAELNKIMELTESGDKSAILIVGAPGVGKTTFLKSLAVRMVVEDVPQILRDKRLVGFDFTRAFAMANTIEVFKRRFESVMEEVSGAKNIILVIDDLHQLINIRPEYAAEVVGILSKAIDTYNIRLICTATPEGFSKYIKPQQTLISMFDVVDMPEPKDEIAMQILLDELPTIEAKYKIKVEFEAIQKAIKLSHKFAFERVLPDKALDLLEEACVRATNEKLQFVSEQQVDELVSEKVGVNVGVVSSDEAKSLIGLEEKLHSRVVGQEDAVAAVASAMRRSRTGLTSDKRPIASFLFFGPTGVGKTELAKAVAATYYGDEKLMIRIDMSEYQEEQNVGRLIGEAGDNSFQGGYLTEAVRQRPFSLILLDEIEKANPKVLDLFLQILDEGQVTDGMGRKIEFKNTIIIATSNVASKEIADAVTQGMSYQKVLEQVMPKLRTYLRIEFINRFDKVVMFRPLTRIDILKISNLMLDKVKSRMAENEIQLVYSKEVVEEVARLGYDPIYGARELNRVIQDKVEDEIARAMLEKGVKAGGSVIMNKINEIITK